MIITILIVAIRRDVLLKHLTHIRKTSGLQICRSMPVVKQTYVVKQPQLFCFFNASLWAYFSLNHDVMSRTRRRNIAIWCGEPQGVDLQVLTLEEHFGHQNQLRSDQNPWLISCFYIGDSTTQFFLGNRGVGWRSFGFSVFDSMELNVVGFDDAIFFWAMKKEPLVVYGIWGFPKKWWVSPTTWGFPTKNDHFGVFWGYHHLRKHTYIGDEIRIPSYVWMIS